MISLVVYQENRQLSRTKINRACSLQLFGLRVKIRFCKKRLLPVDGIILAGVCVLIHVQSL